MPQQGLIIYSMRKYATTVDNNIQGLGNMPQQWIIIYRNEEICHNSG
jgi:hypothetical protein